MPATQLIATGDTSANSADFDVAAGLLVTIALKDASAKAYVNVYLKDDAGAYVNVGRVFAAEAKCIQAPGTYRVSRLAGVACGVFRA